MMSNSAFESAGSGTRLLGEFCTVEKLVGQGNLCPLYGISQTRIVPNACLYTCKPVQITPLIYGHLDISNNCEGCNRGFHCSSLELCSF